VIEQERDLPDIANEILKIAKPETQSESAERFRIRIISTEPDLGETRAALAVYLTSVYGVHVDANPVDPAVTELKTDLLVLLQGLWWAGGTVARAWKTIPCSQRLVFATEESSVWPPAALFEFRFYDQISAFRKELTDAMSFRDPSQLAEVVGKAVNQTIIDRRDANGVGQEGLSPSERAYLEFRLPGWRSGKSVEGRRHVIDLSGSPEAYRPEQYLPLFGRSDSWAPEPEGNIVRRAPDKTEANAVPRSKLREATVLAEWVSAQNLPHTVIVGLPGAGKTTFITRLAASLACLQLGRPERLEPNLNIDGLRTSSGRLPIPMVLEATRLGRRSDNGLKELLEIIAEELGVGRPDLPSKEDEIAAALGEGRFLLLVDALDEVWSVDDREKLLTLLKAIASRYRRTRIVLTTRSASYTGQLSFEPEFEVIHLLELDRTQQEAFCANWTRIRYRDDKYLAGLMKALSVLAESGASAEGSLTGTPLMLTAVCMVFEKHGSLPNDRGQLCSVLVEDLCRSRHSQDTVRGWELDAETKRQLLERIALAMQEEGAQFWPTDRAIQEIIASLPSPLNDAPARGARYVNWLAEHTGLIRFQEAEGGGEEIRFWHRLFREYLAACRLANQDLTAASLVQALFDSRRLTDHAWTDVLRLLPRALGNFSKAKGLWEALVELSDRFPETEGRILGLAQSAVIESRGLFRGLEVQAIAKRLAERYEVIGEKWPCEDRAFFLDALGRFDPQGGDPRILKERWIYVPGEAAKAGDILSRASPLLGAIERRNRSLKPFMIRWAPVTVREASAYVTANDAESRKKWYPMSQPPSGSKDPEGIVGVLDRQILRPNWPAVNLDIFDIRAYCEWRTAQRADGRNISLPSEAFRLVRVAQDRRHRLNDLHA
jgi:hypothetical protein